MFSNINKKRILSLKNFLIYFLPIIFFASYFYLIGRNRYYVSSDVVVRKSEDLSSSSLNLGSFLLGGNKGSLEDARYLKKYLKSPQILMALQNEINFDESYAKKGIDIFAGINSGLNFDKKYDFFKKQVIVNLDEAGGIITIKTFAFDPKTSFIFNKFLIRKSESFINKLNQDIFLKQLDFIQDQVVLNEKKLKNARQQYSNFQKQNKSLDIESEGKFNAKFVSALESELVKLKVELSTLKRKFVDQNAPEIWAVEDQIKELSNQIKLEKKNMFNPEGKNYNQKIASKLELETNLKFTGDLYSKTLSAFEKVRLDSLSQQRFMSLISKPVKPEVQWINWRNKGFMNVTIVFYLIILLFKTLLLLIKSHKE